ncbi:MAG: Na+/H+ antiporter NhaC family protein [Proteocatella sp.]
MSKSNLNQKSSAFALLPIFVFLALFFGTGIIFNDFYKMPAIVGFLAALFVAFIQNRELSFNEKLSVMSRGAGHENIMIMCLIFLLAGAFSGSVKAAGGIESTVNLGLSILPSNFAVVGLFLIGCFISVSMGTSMGTIAALAPIAVGISEKTGFPIELCIGSVVCGAMFGDNLSMISDTTIAAVRTQGCQMKDKFKQNFFIVLPAAILTVVIFLVKTSGGSFAVAENLDYSLLRVMPYIVVLAGALFGMNVFALLLSGTVISLGVGLFQGTFAFGEIFNIVGDGMAGMFEITVLSIIIGGTVEIVKENGGINAILNLIKSKVNSAKGAEFGIAFLASAVDICTANNTVAIVMAGPIAKEISDEFGVDPKRSASILDIFTSVFQGLIPYGAQLLTAASLVGITPFDIIPNLYYPILMGISALLFIALRKEVKVEKNTSAFENKAA